VAAWCPVVARHGATPVQAIGSAIKLQRQRARRILEPLAACGQHGSAATCHVSVSFRLERRRKLSIARFAQHPHLRHPAARQGVPLGPRLVVAVQAIAQVRHNAPAGALRQHFGHSVRFPRHRLRDAMRHQPGAQLMPRQPTGAPPGILQTRQRGGMQAIGHIRQAQGEGGYSHSAVSASRFPPNST
jgi:hypothetical protein